MMPRARNGMVIRDVSNHELRPLAVLTVCLAALAGCEQPAAVPKNPAPTTKPVAATGDGTAEPCIDVPSQKEPATQAGKLEAFAEGSPFRGDYKPPTAKEGKRMWAKSCLWSDAPELNVEKWLTAKPETKGKYVLIEFWATWCPPCRRSIHLLNRLHERFGKELVVIGISDESEADVRKLKDPAIKYYSAIDTQARTKKELGVWGIPHVIVIEPGGAVVWEGFPLLKGYELTEQIVDKILAVGRKPGAGGGSR